MHVQYKSSDIVSTESRLVIVRANTITSQSAFFIIPTRGRILGSRRPVASEQELAWLVVFISADYGLAEGYDKITQNPSVVCAIIWGYPLIRSASLVVAGIPVFIIDTPIPSWIGLRDKKASGFIPVCALVPVFYVSHDICLTYIICMSLIWGTYDTRHRIEAYISESQSGLSWMSCLAFLCTWCGRGDISNPSPILNILTYFFTAPLYGHVNGRWIKATVLDGIMQSTTSLLRYMMAWCMLRYERYQALAA